MRNFGITSPSQARSSGASGASTISFNPPKGRTYPRLLETTSPDATTPGPSGEGFSFDERERGALGFVLLTLSSVALMLGSFVILLMVF